MFGPFLSKTAFSIFWNVAIKLENSALIGRSNFVVRFQKQLSKGKLSKAKGNFQKQITK